VSGASLRVGQGMDAHKLVAGRPLVLGGVPIPYGRGLAGHSDGDVLLHAVASAVLGALGAGDLGQHFPSSDPGLEGVASTRILKDVASRARAAGYHVGNLDATVVAQAPRLAPYVDKMEAMIASILEVSQGDVNVKITSTDGLGAAGRGEGIAALAVVCLVREGRAR